MAPAPPPQEPQITPVTPEQALPSAPSRKTGGDESIKESVLQIFAGSKVAIGATLIVTEGPVEEEETLIKDEKSDDGKVAFPVTQGQKYNIYGILDGYDLFIKRGCSAANLPQVLLRPLSPGKVVSLGQKGLGISLLGGDSADLIPVRANQGSPVFEWLFKVGRSGVVADGGRRAPNGEFWLKQGETVHLRGESKKASFKFITSIARKYVVLESR
jgi:hypothetical protein